MTESQLLAAIRLALGQDPRVVLWRNNTGMAEQQGRPVRYGLCVGSSDLIGIVAVPTATDPLGRFIALEVKTATGRVAPEQWQFIELVNRRGGYACVVRSVEDALAAVDAAANGDAPGIAGRRC